MDASIALWFLVLPAIAIGLAATFFWIWMLVDAIQNEPSIGNDKLIWVLVIILLGFLGAGIYFFVRRPQRTPWMAGK